MPIKVAVIGSGVGAASTCYFLKKLLHEKVHIEVFERSPHIGGRTESIRIDGQNMELGAGIAYSGNRYIKGWAKEFGLVEVKPPKNKFGLWNGDNFVFKESSISALTAVKIVDRYGSDLLSLRTAVYEATSKFDKIYGLQEDGVCFDTAGDLWRHLGLHTYTQQSFKEAMASKLSPSSKLLSELMFAVNKVNYNQSNDVNALAGIGE